MNNETALNIIQEEYDEDEYEVIEVGEDGFVKHDITAYYIIVLRKSDSTYWNIAYLSSYNYGLEEDSVRVEQVKKVEFVQTVWRAVK
jgi:hypothetical protein